MEGEKSHAGKPWSSITAGGDHDGSHGGPRGPATPRDPLDPLGFVIGQTILPSKENVIPKLQLGVVEKKGFLATVVDRILEETLICNDM